MSLERVIAIAITALLALLACAAWFADVPTPSGEPTVVNEEVAIASAIPVTPQEAMRAFHADPAKARALYQGRPLLVRGNVRRVSSDGSHPPMLDLATDTPATAQATIVDGGWLPDDPPKAGAAVAMLCSNLQWAGSTPSFAGCVLQRRSVQP